MEIMKDNDLLLPYQFILGPHRPQVPPSWKTLEINAFWYLSFHPALTVELKTTPDNILVLIGYVLDPDRPQASNTEIVQRLSAVESFADLISASHHLAGHWVLIQTNGSQMQLLHDCAGARAVYFTDVGQTRSLWIASQPRLIASVLALQSDRSALDFINALKAASDDFWWPGDISPFREIKALLPNHYLDSNSGQAIRYWPDRPLVPLSSEEALPQVAKRLKGIMSASAQRFDLALALSGGWDSRVMLSACREIKDNICVYNGKRPGVSIDHPDIAIPRRLIKKLGLDYHYLPQSRDVDSDFSEAFAYNAQDPHQAVLPGLFTERNHFNRQKVGVTGNVLEVARFHFKIADPQAHPPTGEFLASLTEMSEHPFAIAAFENWLESTGTIYNVSAYDLFHWEQRVGRWLSNNCLVFYMAWKEVLFAFNCRRLLIDLLSVPVADRMPPNYFFYRTLIEYMWPDLLSEPINPAPKSSMASRVLNKVKRYFQNH